MTTAVEINVPILRFSEFSGEWYEANLSHFTNSIASGKYKPDAVGQYFVYGSTGVIGKSDTFSHDGSFILVARVGANAGMVNYVNDKFCVTDNTLIVDFKPQTSTKFFCYCLIKNNLNRLVSGSGQPLITGGQLKSLKVLVPSLPEQQKIASFLTAIDAKIELLTKKKTLLEQYKKGVMQQLFSQQLRFKDDEGCDFPDWDEKVLGVGLIESRIVGSKGDKAKKLTVKLWGKGVYEKNEATEGSENTQYYIRNAGQLIYSKLDFLNCAFGIIPKYLDGFQSTLDLPTFDIDQSIFLPEFLLARITRKDFYKQFGDTADGSRKAKRIHPKDFLNFPLSLPSLPEQQKIVAFLNSFDTKIALVNNQVHFTKNYKKGLLQMLFV